MCVRVCVLSVCVRGRVQSVSVCASNVNVGHQSMYPGSLERPGSPAELECFKSSIAGVYRRCLGHHSKLPGSDGDDGLSVIIQQNMLGDRWGLYQTSGSVRVRVNNVDVGHQSVHPGGDGFAMACRSSGNKKHRCLAIRVLPLHGTRARARMHPPPPAADALGTAPIGAWVA